MSDGLAEGEEESDGCDDGSSDSEGEIDGTSVGASVFFAYAPVQSAVRQKAWYRMVNFVVAFVYIFFLSLCLIHRSSQFQLILLPCNCINLNNKDPTQTQNERF